MAWPAFPPDCLAIALTDAITEITEVPNLPRRYRTYPRVVKRNQPHHHAMKKPHHKGTRYNRPPKTHLYKVGLT
jgi:hypothetical protein